MTTINGTINTYDIVGIKEDISDIITNISPTKTPFQSMIGSEGMTNTLHQWQEDSLLAAGQNAAVEGADAPTAVAQPTVMRNNNSQILTKTAKASGTADVVKKYGRDKELSYQLGLRSMELKRDLEYAFVGTGQAAVAGSDTVARQMGGYQVQVAASSTVANTASPLVETNVLTVAQECYTQGAEPNVLMVKPGDAPKIALWKSGIAPGGANPRQERVDNASRKLYNVVDVYVTPFSDEGLKVVLNRFLLSTTALIFETTMWKKLVLRNWFRETLAKTGDSTNVQIVGEFSLKHRNYAASGLITGLSA